MTRLPGIGPSDAGGRRRLPRDRYVRPSAVNGAFHRTRRAQPRVCSTRSRGQRAGTLILPSARGSRRRRSPAASATGAIYSGQSIRARAGPPDRLMDRAVARFPDDGRSLGRRLQARALQPARRNAPCTQHGLLPVGAGLTRQLALASPTGSPGFASRLARSDRRSGGPPRLGFLHWALGDAAARDELAKAAGQAGDSDVRYLAQFLLGWIAVVRGDSAAAIPPLEAALAARPDSQSAAIALASLELQRGDADKAHRIAQASLDRRHADADPWRLFLYGHHPQWPERIAQPAGWCARDAASWTRDARARHHADDVASRRRARRHSVRRRRS